MTVPSPEPGFWYVLAILLISFASWVIVRFLNKMEKVIDHLTENVNELTVITKLHDHTIHDHEARIYEVEKEIKNLRIPKRNRPNG